MKAGDILVSYDGQPITCARKLQSNLRGKVVEANPKELSILRAGRPLTQPVAPGALDYWSGQFETRAAKP